MPDEAGEVAEAGGRAEENSLEVGPSHFLAQRSKTRLSFRFGDPWWFGAHAHLPRSLCIVSPKNPCSIGNVEPGDIRMMIVTILLTALAVIAAAFLIDF